MQNLLATLNTRLDIHPYRKKTHDVLQKDGAIVIFNHPYELETIVTVAALPKRNDIHIIITKHSLDVCERLNKHLLPIDIDHHAEKEKARKLGGMLVNWLHLRPKTIESEARLFNRNTIAKAARIVKGGGIVAMCPQGPRSDQKPWFDGIGHLLHQVGVQKNCSIIFAFITGTSNLDYFRLIPRLGSILPNITLTFSQPMTIKRVLNHDKSPKQIRAYLEKTYKHWVKTIH